MLVLYVAAGFVGAFATVSVLAQSGWLFALLAAPLVASTFALVIAGVSAWIVSRRPHAAAQIPSGVVWC